jgi:hypothetical protein
MIRSLRILMPILALAAGSACSSGSEGADPPPTAAVATDVPTSSGAVDRRSLPEPLQHVSGLAGADEAEASCIDAQMVTALVPGTAIAADALPGVAGTAVVQCLSPAKLAAALTERLASPALGLGLDEAKLECARATFVQSAADPALTVLVGGLALGEADVVRQGAAPLDAACGTGLAPAGGD